MIGKLTGRVLECSPGLVVLDVAGVGYELQIPLSTFYALSASDGSPASLHVHTHVREDVLALYGFATREERETFERLIGISGVGPRTALAVLSGIGVEEMEGAVRDGDRARLERIPGIGRRTAERMILELKDRLGREGTARRASRGRREPPPARGAAAWRAAMREDAVSALVNLGYRPEAAARAVDAALPDAGDDAATLESVLKAALRGLIR